MEKKITIIFTFVAMIAPSVITDKITAIKTSIQPQDTLNIDNFNNKKAQSISSNNTIDIMFYGNNKNPNKIGGEYIVFKVQNNIAQGLVYVQNSDVFSCFKGNYNSQDKSLQQLIFTYPDMESGIWIKTSSDEFFPLTDYPYALDYNQISQGANSLFQECINQ